LRPHLLADLDRAIGLDVPVAFVARSGWILSMNICGICWLVAVVSGTSRADYHYVREPEALSGLLDLDGALDLRGSPAALPER
jgi:hypothetical protein